MKNKKIIFSTSSYEYLSAEILKLSGAEKGTIEKNVFPDDEIYHRVLNEVEGRDAVLIGGTISDTDTLEIFDIACALVQYGVDSLTLVLPYYGYSTMERAVQSGEVVKAKTRAVLLSSILHSPKGNKVMLLDLHTEGLPHYFEEGLRPVHIYGKSIVMETVEKFKTREVVLASTDAGRAKWVESLANDMGLNAAFVLKRRVSGEESVVTSISADVKDKDVVIYDDMIRTGGSIVNAAKAYKQAGAKDIYVITTHGLFNGGGLEKIKNCGLVKKVFSTNSHPNALKIKDDFLEVKSVAGLIEEYLDKSF
jgi:ribose-phosphate pyrophosphokinase